MPLPDTREALSITNVWSFWLSSVRYLGLTLLIFKQMKFCGEHCEKEISTKMLEIFKTAKCSTAFYYTA